ncbi:MAG: hypothetical protein JST16_09050 [Bdellovibrionales bacterium]|nr:hypothetical protein [Bdellovibrionales bacterium]
MGLLDQYVNRTKSEPQPAAPASRLVIPELEEAGPVVPVPELPTQDGRGVYQACFAPVNERREWFFLLRRTGGHEALRYELINKYLFSPDGSQLAMIYVDSIYVLKGRRLSEFLPKLLDRYAYSVDEYDATRHLPLTDQACVITAVESYGRNTPQGQQSVADVKAAKKS